MFVSFFPYWNGRALLTGKIELKVDGNSLVVRTPAAPHFHEIQSNYYAEVMQNSALPRVLRVARIVPQPAHQFERRRVDSVSRAAPDRTGRRNSSTGEAEIVAREMPELGASASESTETECDDSCVIFKVDDRHRVMYCNLPKVKTIGQNKSNSGDDNKTN